MRKSRALEAILNELKKSPKTWSELETACRMENISKSAFYFQLKKLIENKQIEKDDKTGAYKLHETKIEPADPNEINFLLAVVEKRSSEQAVKAALKDFEELCRCKEVTGNERVWSFFLKAIDDMSYGNHWPLLMERLLFIASESKRKNDETSINRLKSDFLPKLIDIARSSKPDFLPEEDARQSAIATISFLLDDAEKFETYKKIVEEITRNEAEEETWQSIVKLFFQPLKSLYQEKKTDVWNWLYPLMENKDERIRKRALFIHQALHS